MRIRLVVFSVILIVVGLFLYIEGNSTTANRTFANDPLSGLYMVITGIFLIIAAVLVLASQVFRRKSVLYY